MCFAKIGTQTSLTLVKFLQYQLMIWFCYGDGVGVWVHMDMRKKTG